MSTIIYPPERNEATTQNKLLDESEQQSAPRDYMVWSVIGNVCCMCTCMFTLLCSIPALIFSLNTKENVKIGDFSKAKKNSLFSFLCNSLTALTIILFCILSIVLIVYILMLGASGVKWFCELPLNFTC